MARWRDIRRAALRDAQDTLRVPAIYVAGPGATPLPVSVRILDRATRADSDHSETGFGFLFDLTPWIVFDLDEDPDHLTGRILAWAEHSPVHRLRRRVRQNYPWQAIFRRDIEPLLQGRETP